MPTWSRITPNRSGRQRERAADGDAAGAAALAGQARGRRVVLVDQVLAAGDEVEHVLSLVCL
jgi:hypothetical protein